jgi:hypothetical protein
MAASLVSWKRASRPIPALAITTSGTPRSASTRAAMASMDALSATSAWTGTMRGLEAASSWSLAKERASARTVPPSAAKARAAARPIPCEAPVIRTSLPWKRPGTRGS